MSNPVIVKRTGSAISIYVNANSTPATEWICIGVDAYDLTPNRGSGWNWSRLKRATRTGAATFTDGDSLAIGEAWIAIQEDGKPDFMGGGTHGDEVGTAFEIKLDGVVLDETGTGTDSGTTVEITVDSEMYEVGGAALTATVSKVFTITANTLTLSQFVTFNRAITVSYAYLGMCGWYRNLAGNGANPLQSDTAVWEPDYTPYDISASGHAAPYVNSSLVRLTGPSQLTLEMEATAGWTDSARRLFVQDTTTYNKVYFAPWGIPANRAVNTDDTLETTVVYRLSNLNEGNFMATCQFTFGYPSQRYGGVPAIDFAGATIESETVSASSAATTASAVADGIVRVCSDTACYVTFGANPTATSSNGVYLPANVVEYFGVQAGAKGAVIAA